jgi:hypothetical protein
MGIGAPCLPRRAKGVQQQPETRRTNTFDTVEREPVGQIGIGEVITRNRQIVGSDVGDGERDARDAILRVERLIFLGDGRRNGLPDGLAAGSTTATVRFLLRLRARIAVFRRRFQRSVPLSVHQPRASHSSSDGRSRPRFVGSP